jgi:hypothetical protein
MAIRLGNYSFTGPFESIDDINDWSGIYAIVCNVDQENFLLDVGESSKLRTRIENHDKKDCWINHCKGQLKIYIHYTLLLKQPGRILIERVLREHFQPDCKTATKIWFK